MMIFWILLAIIGMGVIVLIVRRGNGTLASVPWGSLSKALLVLFAIALVLMVAQCATTPADKNSATTRAAPQSRIVPPTSVAPAAEPVDTTASRCASGNQPEVLLPADGSKSVTVWGVGGCDPSMIPVPESAKYQMWCVIDANENVDTAPIDGTVWRACNGWKFSAAPGIQPPLKSVNVTFMAH